MSFEPFQQFIKRAANRYGISKEVEAAKICQDFRVLMEEDFFKNKPFAKEYVKPAYYKDKILVVNVGNPAWAQEIIMRRPKIIEEMNKKAGKEVIKTLKTQLYDAQNNQ